MDYHQSNSTPLMQFTQTSPQATQALGHVDNVSSNVSPVFHRGVPNTPITNRQPSVQAQQYRRQYETEYLSQTGLDRHGQDMAGHGRLSLETTSQGPPRQGSHFSQHRRPGLSQQQRNIGNAPHHTQNAQLLLNRRLEQTNNGLGEQFMLPETREGSSTRPSTSSHVSQVRAVCHLGQRAQEPQHRRVYNPQDDAPSFSPIVNRASSQDFEKQPAAPTMTYLNSRLPTPATSSKHTGMPSSQTRRTRMPQRQPSPVGIEVSDLQPYGQLQSPASEAENQSLSFSITPSATEVNPTGAPRQAYEQVSDLSGPSAAITNSMESAIESSESLGPDPRLLALNVVDQSGIVLPGRHFGSSRRLQYPGFLHENMRLPSGLSARQIATHYPNHMTDDVIKVFGYNKVGARTLYPMVPQQYHDWDKANSDEKERQRKNLQENGKNKVGKPSFQPHSKYQQRLIRVRKNVQRQGRTKGQSVEQQAHRPEEAQLLESRQGASEIAKDDRKSSQSTETPEPCNYPQEGHWVRTSDVTPDLGNRTQSLARKDPSAFIDLTKDGETPRQVTPASDDLPTKNPKNNDKIQISISRAPQKGASPDPTPPKHAGSAQQAARTTVHEEARSSPRKRKAETPHQAVKKPRVEQPLVHKELDHIFDAHDRLNYIQYFAKTKHDWLSENRDEPDICTKWQSFFESWLWVEDPDPEIELSKTFKYTKKEIKAKRIQLGLETKEGQKKTQQPNFLEIIDQNGHARRPDLYNPADDTRPEHFADGLEDDPNVDGNDRNVTSEDVAVPKVKKATRRRTTGDKPPSKPKPQGQRAGKKTSPASRKSHGAKDSKGKQAPKSASKSETQVAKSNSRRTVQPKAFGSVDGNETVANAVPKDSDMTVEDDMVRMVELIEVEMASS